MHRLLTLLLLVSACDAGTEHLSFAVVERGSLPGGAPTYGETAPSWGGTETMPKPDTFELLATMPLGDDFDRDVLELYDDAGARVAMICELLLITEPDTGDNPHQDWICPMAQVADGTYRLIHRERTGTGRPINCVGDCPWIEFDGEPALSLTLVLGPR